MLPMRFLLSHNHNIPESVAPALTPAAFSTVFQTHLAGHLGDAIVSPIDHPHWRCAVETTAAPEAVGQALGSALKQARSTNGPIAYQILALGGLKTTPATAPDPNALQPGEWGVDVVETLDAVAFFADLGWDKLTAGRSADELFQVRT
jgi:Protein of unknown function (DUF2656)